jgi:hypothetical protein
MLKLNVKGVEVFIKKSRSKQRESFWNNYDLIIWNKNHMGFYSKSGMFRNNSWGISEIFPISDDGIWEMPVRYVKYFQ